MNDESMLELEREFLAEQEAEYRRGIRLGNSRDGIIEDCPWCDGKYKYHFDPLTNWNCWSCGFYPGADLLGGQYS